MRTLIRSTCAQAFQPLADFIIRVIRVTLIRGGNSINAAAEHDVVAIRVDDAPLIWFRFEENCCLLNVGLFDENNDVLLAVVDN